MSNEPFQIINTDVQGESFDLVAKFIGSSKTCEIFFDENVQLLIDGLCDKYGQVMVKVNWFSKDVMIIIPPR